MNKVISGLAGIALLASCSNAVIKKELKVGDKMPKFFGRAATSSSIEKGIMISYHPYTDGSEEIIDDKNFEYAIAVSVIKNCGYMKHFAAFNYSNNEIYEDVNGDGIIDSKFSVLDNEIGEIAIKMITPNCAKLESGKIL